MGSKKIIAAVCAAAMGMGASQLPVMSAGAISTPLTSNNGAELPLGDVNNDKTVDSKDASAILEEYSLISTGQASIFTSAQSKAADVDKNGTVDSSDASWVLAYYSYVSTGGLMNMESFMAENQTPAVTTTTTGVTTTTTAKPTTTTTKQSTTTTAKPTTTTTKQSTTTTAKPTTTTTKQSTTTTAKPTTTTTKQSTTTTAKPTTTTTKQSTTTTTTITTTSTTTTVTTSATTASTVSDRVSSIRLSKDTLNINVGEGGLAAYVTMFPATAKNKAELWSSDNEAVAIVDGEGWVTGISEGVCTITVKSADNPSVKAEVKVTVTDISTVKEIRLSRYEMTLEAGTGALSANVTMLPTTAKDKGEIWSSDNEAVAYTDSEGWVVGVAPGVCTITVQSKSNPEVKAQVKVTVYSNTPAVDRVSEIKLSITEMELKQGERGISYVTMLPETAPNKGEIWTSSDESIAVVDSYGNVTAIRPGKCVVTVTSADNPSVSASVNVSVYDPSKVTEIKLSTYELKIPLGKVDISYVTMLPGSAPDKGEIWVCSDNTVASVDENGWIYGRRLGECTVTVYSRNNPEVKASIKVTIIDPDAKPDVPEPEKLHSFLSDRVIDESKMGFVTMLPKEYSGRFVIDYVIEDSNGIKTTITSSTLLIPEMDSVLIGLTADTDTFTVTSYVTDLSSTLRARIGIYRFCRSAKSMVIDTEEIVEAFEYVVNHKA